jgi:hypothetical protein
MLKDCVVTLRSKNAGAFLLTIDLVFKNRELFETASRSKQLSPEQVAPLYRVNPGDVHVIPYPQVNSIKITLPRLAASGDLEDTDVYGAQQHVALMELAI